MDTLACFVSCSPPAAGRTQTIRVHYSPNIKLWLVSEALACFVSCSPTAGGRTQTITVHYSPYVKLRLVPEALACFVSCSPTAGGRTQTRRMYSNSCTRCTRCRLMSDMSAYLVPCSLACRVAHTAIEHRSERKHGREREREREWERERERERESFCDKYKSSKITQLCYTYERMKY